MVKLVDEEEMKPNDINWLHDVDHVTIRLEALKPSNQAFDREAGTGNVIAKHNVLVATANSLRIALCSRSYRWFLGGVLMMWHRQRVANQNNFLPIIVQIKSHR